MKLKPEEIIVTNEDPFKDDLLNRKESADVLSQIIKNTEGGFTLSINAPWGYGKTTFVKMWEKALQNEGYKTIYFNAWETDFVADPMMALIDGIINNLGDTLSEDNKKFFSALIDSLIQLGKLVPVLNPYASIAEAIKKGTDKLSETDSQLQEYRSLKNLVDDFREKLSEYAKAVNEEKQLIIFVDEIDRCRPDYAVQMLERIKHFFAIDNIIFVLSVDREVLCKSIKAVYGSLDIDTEAYLRRFVDLEFDLPEPNIADFIDAQIERSGIGIYFTNYEDQNRKRYYGEDRAATLRIALSDCLKATSKSLRDVEKYFNRLGIIFSSKDLSHKHLDLTSYLLYLYMFNRDIYDHLLKIDLTVPNMWAMMQKQINSITPDSQSEHYRRYMGMVIDTLAAYIDKKDQKNNYRHETLKEDPGLEWFPQDYRDWLKDEISNHRGELLTQFCSHIELLKNVFNWEKIK